MGWSRLRRAAALAFGLSLPGLLVLAGLTAAGAVAGGPAVIGAGALLALMGLIAGPYAIGMSALRDAVERLTAEARSGEGGLAPPAERLKPPANALGLSLLRLIRAWRDRVTTAEARSAAAEAVIAAVPDPLILLDEKRQIVRANAHSAEFVGTVSEPRDLAGFLRHPGLLAAADAVLRGEPARLIEFTLPLPVERRLRARFARIPNSSANTPALDGAVAVLTLYDVTALRRAEQMRDDFIANAGHELKTPLAALLGFIETLRGPARSDAKARERFLGIMQDQAQRMARLVADMLSLSRIELNEHVAPTGRVALAAVLQHVAEGLELRAAERRMRIALRFEPGLPEVCGDRDELAQLFQNLLDNAIKYGRPETEIAVEACLVATTRDGTPQLRVSVADRGDGIAKEHVPRLTERFYRVDTARSREMGGTGLGLAIVKHIVNRHRGALEIESTPGVGSRFTVLLRPVAEPGQASAAP
ncbi:MAG: hypothetical protein JO038_02270 [Alphaproteobacteria bacterium]|nr:hypothetical protein [Alphaproteobacteria bacterium]